ncbi:hypothetical protein MMPV_000654 [Pyropia vietnamensis]
MGPEAFSSPEKAFAVAALASGARVDGRRPPDGRRVSITLSPTTPGSATASFGPTVATAAVSVRATPPRPGRPIEGTLSVSVTPSAAASEAAAAAALSRRAAGAGGAATPDVVRLVEGALRSSRALDTEALCIVAGALVWAVTVEVTLVADAGNAGDVATAAAVAAVLGARRPDVSVRGGEATIHSLEEREGVPLPVAHVPFAVTFALFADPGGGGATAGGHGGGALVAVDPISQEEAAADGTLSLTMNAHGEVCGLVKSGGLPVPPSLIVSCAQAAAERVLTLTRIAQRAVDDSAAAAAAAVMGSGAESVARTARRPVEHPLAAARPVLVDRQQPMPLGVAGAAETTAGGGKRRRRNEGQVVHAPAPTILGEDAMADGSDGE